MHYQYFKRFHYNKSQRHLFKITAPIPGGFLPQVQTDGCLASLSKASTSCCFCALGFTKWKVFASVFSSGAESSSSTSGSSCNSDSEMGWKEIVLKNSGKFSSRRATWLWLDLLSAVRTIGNLNPRLLSVLLLLMFPVQDCARSGTRCFW